MSPPLIRDVVSLLVCPRPQYPGFSVNSVGCHPRKGLLSQMPLNALVYRPNLEAMGPGRRNRRNSQEAGTYTPMSRMKGRDTRLSSSR